MRRRHHFRLPRHVAARHCFAQRERLEQRAHGVNVAQIRKRHRRDAEADVDGKRNLRSISPLKIHPKHIRKLREGALEHLPPDFADTVCKTERPFVQPIYDLVCERIAYQRIALVGDAAFTARPHVGAGVTKAGGDAIALAEALRNIPDVARALEEYRRRREPFGRAIVERGRYLGGYLESPKRGAVRKPPLSAQELIRECAMPIRLAHQKDCTQ